jgi:hypothetical protein
MSNQSFNIENLKRLVRRDFSKYDLGRTADDRSARLKELSESISHIDYDFAPLRQIRIGSNLIFSATTLQDDFALRKLNDNIKRLLRLKQSNRTFIIHQLKHLICDEVPMSIIKLDIKQFYETIDKQKAVEKILNNSLLSVHSKRIFERFFSLPEISAIHGLPRGINISSILSEAVMQPFDLKAAQLPTVYFYARYVDDIIIFTYKNPKETISKLESILEEETGLKLNSQKTKIIEKKKCRCTPNCTCHANCPCRDKCVCSYDSAKRISFDYLGYNFTFSDISKKSNEVFVSLAKNKIRKIKRRIILSFLDYAKSKDFLLLENRIAYLTGNFLIKENNGKCLYAGIFYNYSQITEEGLEELGKLTTFLKRTIYAKRGSFSIKIASLSDENRKALAKYCFRAGFIHRKIAVFTAKQIYRIKQCWAYD